MKKAYLVFILCLSPVLVFSASTLYVRGTAVVHTVPNSHAPMLTTLPTGTAVKLIALDDRSNFSLVNIDKVGNGWVANQFLTKIKPTPAKKVVKTTMPSKPKLSNDALLEYIGALVSVAPIDNTVTIIKNRLGHENQALKQALIDLETRYVLLQRYQNRSSMLTGAGIILLGLLIGLLLPKLVRRRQDNWGRPI